MTIRASVVLLLLIGLQRPAGSAAPQTSDCVRFSQTRLAAGAPFSATLPLGLEFRLTPDWHLTVVPLTQPTIDYLWVVSPPLRTAPHLVIGPAYGLSARESVGMVRDLRFVLTAEDYAAATTAINSTLDAGEILKRLDALGKGRLSFVITGSGLRSETLEWIAFRGEGCVPKSH